MRNILVLACLLLSPTAVLASEAPSGMTQFNVMCPAQRLLSELDAAFHECGHELGGKSCSTFVSLFRQLLPEFDCQRPFDHSPSKDYVVPAVWLAGAAHEDFVHLLSTLQLPAARCLFGSAAFRATLDGALAEDYSDKSRRVERALGSSCNGL
jgi:hypothetical protein